MAIFALSPLDRILMLNGFFPEQEDFVTLRRITNFTEKISFSDEEMDKWGISTVNGVFKCNAEARDIEVEIGEVLLGKIEDILKGKNADKTLNVNLLGLYEKFVEKSTAPTNGKPELAVAK